MDLNQFQQEQYLLPVLNMNHNRLSRPHARVANSIGTVSERCVQTAGPWPMHRRRCHQPCAECPQLTLGLVARAALSLVEVGQVFFSFRPNKTQITLKPEPSQRPLPNSTLIPSCNILAWKCAYPKPATASTPKHNAKKNPEPPAPFLRPPLSPLNPKPQNLNPPKKTLRSKNPPRT